MAGSNRQIYVNLPVRDPKRSTEFFRRLGFEFNTNFSDQNAACMIIGQDSFAMLLAESYFKTFTKRDVCDTRTHTEALLAVSCPTREAVDEMVETALASGGSAAMPAQDHGFMFVSSFYDLDGHHWEVMWMDPNAPH